MTPPPLTLCELADPGIPGLETYSPYCLKVHRGLRAAGLAYTRRHGSNPGAFKQYNPARQVPVLLIGEEAIADSTDILRRLDAFAPVPIGSDPDPVRRAEAWLWEDFADSSLNAYLIAARWADDRNWPAVRDALLAGVPTVLRSVLGGIVRPRIAARAQSHTRGGMDACWRQFGDALDALDARSPRTSWWMGEGISVADVAIYGQLHQIRQAITPWQRDQIAARAALTAYLDRVGAATAEPLPG